MICGIRDSRKLRIFWLLLAVHFLNISVDSQDIRPDYTAEDLSINDQESVMEIVLEQVLEIENAVPEHDESDAEGKNGNNNRFQPDPSVNLVAANGYTDRFANDATKQAIMESEHRVDSGFHRIETPPPRS